MSRYAKGPRLYLRAGRRDPRTGRALPDIYFVRDGAVQRSTGCGPDRLPDAEAALQAYLAEKWAAQAPAPADRRRDPAQVLVSEVIALYAAERAGELAGDPATFSGFVDRLLEWWSGKSLSDVRRSTCRAYVAKRCSDPRRSFKDPTLAPRVSDQTARRELETLSAAIGYWHGEDKLHARPEVWLPPKPDSPRDALTRSQAADLLRAALGSRKNPVTGRWARVGVARPDPVTGQMVRLGGSARSNRAHLRRFILIALYTGTRHSVITRLLWEESPHHAWVDLDAGLIYRRGRREREHATKRRPVVKLPPRLLAHLRRWRRIDLAKNEQLASVLHHGGAPITGKVRTGFKGCVRDAGLPPEITPHWLRHTAATFMMERGVDMWDAAAYLGMTVKTLEQHYAHHRPGYQAAAAGAHGARR
jgi:integrase